MPDEQAETIPPARVADPYATPYETPFRRAVAALAEHLTRLPADDLLSIDGFRITVSELHGMIRHAEVHLDD